MVTFPQRAPNPEIGPWRNAFNAFMQSGVGFGVDILDLVQFDKTADALEGYMQTNYPTRPGVSQFIGNTAGSILPSVPAVWLRGLGMATKAPKLFDLVGKATIGTYMGQSMGMAQRQAKEYERETGEELSNLQKAGVTVAYGAITGVTERWGLQQVLKGIDKVGINTMRNLGAYLKMAKTATKPEMKDFARKGVERMLMQAGREATVGAVREGLQEVTEEIAHNAATALIYDTDQDLLENAGMAFLGGALGGGMMHGLGAIASTKQFKEGYASGETMTGILEDVPDGEYQDLKKFMGETDVVVEAGKGTQWAISNMDDEIANRFMKSGANIEEIKALIGSDHFSKLTEEQQQETIEDIRSAADIANMLYVSGSMGQIFDAPMDGIPRAIGVYNNKAIKQAQLLRVGYALTLMRRKIPRMMEKVDNFYVVGEGDLDGSIIGQHIEDRPSKGKNTVLVKSNIGNANEILSTIAHEIQHGVDFKSGRMAAADAALDYLRPYRARKVEKWANSTEKAMSLWMGEEFQKGHAVNFSLRTNPYVPRESEEFKERFKKGITDVQGRPQMVFHGTIRNFRYFKKWPVGGTHAGSMEQAESRIEANPAIMFWRDEKTLEQIEKEPYPAATSKLTVRTIPGYLAIQNPLPIRDIGEFRNVRNLLKGLEEVSEDLLPFQDVMNLEETVQKAADKMEARGMDVQGEYAQKALWNSYIRPFLAEHGYDGFVYRNKGEASETAVYGLDNVTREDLERAKEAAEDDGNTLAKQLLEGLRGWIGKNLAPDAGKAIEDLSRSNNEFRLAASEIFKAIRPYLDAAGIDTSNVEVSDDISYSAFDTKQFIPAFLPGTFFQTSSGIDYAREQDAELLKTLLEGSELVEKVVHHQDQAEYDALVASLGKKLAPGEAALGFTIGREIHLAPRFELRTPGHELFHVLTNLLPTNHPLLKQLYDGMRLEGYDGKKGRPTPKEAAHDFVGDLFQQRAMPAGIYARLRRWLGDLFVETRVLRGKDLSTEQIARWMVMGMENPGVYSEALGLPDDWNANKARAKSILEDLGLLVREGEDQAAAFGRLEKLIPSSSAYLYAAIAAKGKGGKMQAVIDRAINALAKDKSAQAKELIAEFNGMAELLGSQDLSPGGVDLMIETILKQKNDIVALFDPNRVKEEIQKVLEGRTNEYTTLTHVVWHYAKEAAQGKAIEMYMKETKARSMHVEVAEALHEYIAQLEESRISPASHAGVMLKWYDQPANSMVHVIQALKEAKNFLTTDEYNVLYQVVTKQKPITHPAVDQILTKLEYKKHKWKYRKDLFYQFYYSMLLSNPPTQIINAGSNALWLGWQVPHRALTGVIDTFVTHEGKTKLWDFTELAMKRHGINSRVVREALKAFKTIIKKGFLTENEGRVIAGMYDRMNIEIGTSATTAFERHPSKWMRALALPVTLPSRMMRAVDLVFKTIAFDKEMRVQLVNYHQNLGHANARERAAAEAEALLMMPWKTENEYNKLRATLAGTSHAISIPFKKAVEMLDRAVAFANYATFMDVPGEFQAGFIKLRNASVVGQVFVPFVNTITNLAKRTAEMTPGLGIPAYYIAGRKPARGGKYYERSRADLAAKQLEGLVITAILMSLFDWDEMTANPPSNPAERERFFASGKIPWAFKANGTWIQYRDIEPFSGVFAYLGSVHQAMTNAPDDATRTDIFEQAARSVWEFFKESTWLSGVERMMTEYGLKTHIQQVPGNLVPYSALFGAINRGLDTKEGGRVLHERPKDFYEGLVREVEKKIPGVGEKGVPTRLDVWGEEIKVPGGFLRQWLPWKWSEEVHDEVEEELARLAVYPAPPSRTMTVGRREFELPEDMYRDYQLYFGKIAKSRLDRVVRRQSYRQAPQDRQVLMIDRALEGARTVARRRARAEFLRTGVPQQARRTRQAALAL